MIDHRPIKNTTLALCFLLLLSFFNTASAQDAAAGKTIFNSKCASCHAVHKQITGPALAGIEERVPDKKKLYAWIRNNQAVLKTGDAYFVALYNQYNKSPMNLFPELEDADIENILAYVRSVPVPGSSTGDTSTDNATSQAQDGVDFSEL